MSGFAWEALDLADLTDPSIANDALADLLRSGQLSLLLGAGISQGMGLPGWETLVTECEKSVDIPPVEGRSSKELMEAIDDVRRELARRGRASDLRNLVRSNLYPEPFLRQAGYPNDIVEQRLLIAIGAMVMASSRGSVADVFTLNFDDLLEWYLHLHGFKTQVVVDFPQYLERGYDVTIFHPHGFLPLMEDVYSESDWLVLSHRELVDRLSDVSAPWPTVIASRLLSRRFLIIGTSLNDLDIEVLLNRAFQAHGGASALGFVIGREISSVQAGRLLEKGLVPVSLDRYEDIPDYLLQICRHAAKG